MAGVDCNCPYCNAGIEVRSTWDYQQEFFTTCESCKKSVCISVISDPVFYASKPTCAKCGKVKQLNSRGYCANCQEFLRAMSGEVLKEIRAGK